MSNTYFIDGVTNITADWLNDVNDLVYGAGPSTNHRATVTAGIGQTVFTVPFTFVQGSLNLTVYIDGIHQILGTSYTENSNNTITFTEVVPTGCVIEFVG